MDELVDDPSASFGDGFGDMTAGQRLALVTLHLDGVSVDDLAELTDCDTSEVLALLADAQRRGEWTALQAARFTENVHGGRQITQAKQEAETWPQARNQTEFRRQVHTLHTQGVSARWIAEWAGRTTLDVARTVMEADAVAEALEIFEDYAAARGATRRPTPPAS